MEYDLNKTSFTVCETPLDTVAEQSVDVDLSLPDYCPDIERVLRCSMTPMIYNTAYSGGQITVDGSVRLWVMYVDSVRGNIRSYEHTEPFSATFATGELPENRTVDIDTKVEYLNCRVRTPRKLSLHGAFSLYLRVCAPNEYRLAQTNDDDDLQLRIMPVTLSELSCLCSEAFSYAEDIALSDRPSIESMLSHEVAVHITDLRSVSGKIHLSAEGELRLMYLSDLENGTLEQMSYTFPISRVIDCDGVEDGTTLIPTLKVMSYDLRAGSDAVSEGALLSLDMRLCFSAQGYEERQLSYITDAFSVSDNVKVGYDRFRCLSDVSVNTYRHVERAVLSAGDDTVARVIRVSADQPSLSYSPSSDRLTLTVKVNLCMLLSDTGDKPFYVERAVEYSTLVDIGAACSVLDARAYIESLSFRIVDEHSVEVRLDTAFTVSSCCERTLDLLSTVETIDDSPLERDDSSLILYYADGGESVWDISKRYLTRPDALIYENGIEGESVPSPMMLLIPM